LRHFAASGSSRSPISRVGWCGSFCSPSGGSEWPKTSAFAIPSSQPKLLRDIPAGSNSFACITLPRLAPMIFSTTIWSQTNASPE